MAFIGFDDIHLPFFYCTANAYKSKSRKCKLKKGFEYGKSESMEGKSGYPYL